MVRPVSGISPVTPPTTTKTCSARTAPRPAARQLAEAVARDQRGAQRALDDDAVEQQHGHQPGQAELLADRGDDEVGLRERHPPRVAVAEAATDQPAPGHPEERLEGLLAAAVGAGAVVGERVEPDVDAGLHVAEDPPRHQGAAEEERPADDQPAGPLGGDVEHHQEEAEEEQAGAEVLLEDQDAEADQPHRPAPARGRARGAGRRRAPGARPGPARRGAAPGSRRRRRPAAPWRPRRAAG